MQTECAVETRPVLKRAKFIKGLNASERTTLTLAVSMENEKQTGEDFMAFVCLVNQHKQRVKKLNIVLSCYLQRHYIGEQAALELFDKWREENNEALSRLDSDIELEIISWRTILDSEGFQQSLQFLTKLYDENEEFRVKVNLLSNRHSYKSDTETAKAYLLEENAFFMVYKGIVCYPGQHLNAANAFVVEKFNKELTFCGYNVFLRNQVSSDSKQKKHQEVAISLRFSPASDMDSEFIEEEVERCGSVTAGLNGDVLIAYASTARLMVQFGIHSPEDQEGCFKKILETIKNYPKSDGGSSNAKRHLLGQGK